MKNLVGSHVIHMMNLLTFAFLIQFFSMSVLFALNGNDNDVSTEINISALVTDENGGFLPGATVPIQGISIGIVTDLDGKYSLAGEQEASLTFSYIGYEKKQ